MVFKSRNRQLTYQAGLFHGKDNRDYSRLTLSGKENIICTSP